MVDIIYWPRGFNTTTTREGGSVTEFNKGDTVSIEGTVDYVSDCGNGYSILLDQGAYISTKVSVSEGKLTLVKKAVPPRPRAGSILRKKGAKRNYCIYTITRDGKIMLLGDGTYVQPSGDFSTWERDHDKLEVVINHDA